VAQLASSPGANVRLIFNDRLDAVVTATLIVMISLILIESVVEWVRVLSGRKQGRVKESPFVATRFATEEQG
jgi:carbon starvation protein